MVLWGHAHRREDRGRRCRAIGSASRARVILATAPRKADPRVSNGITLHLVDGHFSGMALNKLNKTTALSRGDFDVGDFAKALEERAKFVLSDVSGKTSNKDSGVVRVSKLVHRLRSAIVAHRGSTHGIHGELLGSAWHRGSVRTNTLRGSSGNAHGPVATVDTLHLGQGTVLVLLVGEANEAISTRHSADRVGHDLGRLARREPGLEEGDQDIFIDLWSKITNEDGVLRSAVIAIKSQSINHTKEIMEYKPSISESTTGGPVKLERTGAVRDLGAVQRKSLRGSSGGLELDEAVASVANSLLVNPIFLLTFGKGLPRKFIANHLNIHVLTETKPHVANKVFINPGLKFTHPLRTKSVIKNSD